MTPSTAGGTTSVSISFGSIGVIDAVEVSLYKTTGNVFQSTVLLPTAPYSHTFTGLLASTNYYFKFRMLATVNGIQVASNDAAQLGALCTTSNVSTL